MSRYDELSRLLEEIKREVDVLRKESRSEPVPVEDLGVLVKATRVRQKLAQAELADLAGISVATLKRIEFGNKDVAFSNISSVLDALGVKVWIG